MHINRLRLLGFKSFVEPTELVVERGLTGVVGPNGCGKSNLLEALRWVMGETSHKSMRAASMDDVIFSGTNHRPGRNMAEVTIFIDNSDRRAPTEFNDADVLEVTRRIEREMGSAYRINGREARARDVKILFEDAATGARSPALVRQGQISEIVNAKPDQRRRILEDAAGIAGLHSRRHEAELRLRAGETNLARVSDVLGQLGSQIESLKRQARQARRYKELSVEIRRTEALLFHIGWLEANAQVDLEESNLAEALRRLGAATQAESEAMRLEVETADQIQPLREVEAQKSAALHRFKVELENFEKEAERAAVRQKEFEARAEQLKRDLQRETSLVQEARDTVQRLASEKKEIEDTNTVAKDFEAKALAAFEGGEAAVKTLEQRLGAMQTAVAEARAKRRSLEAQRAERQDQVTKLERQIAALDSQMREIAGRAPDASKLKSTAELGQSLMASLSDVEAQALAAEEAVVSRASAAKGQREQAAAVILSAGQLKAEVDTLLKLLRPAGDVDVPLMVDQITVTPGYETALGAALGDDLEAAVAGEQPVRWTLNAATEPDPPLPEGAIALTRFVKGPAELGRRLAQIGLVDRAHGEALHARLKSGQRLVSREGDLWRWDGFVNDAHGQSAAAVRLEQRNRLGDLMAEEARVRQVAEEAARTANETIAAHAAAEAEERRLRQLWRDTQSQLAQTRELLTTMEKQARETETRLAGVRDAKEQASEALVEANIKRDEIDIALESVGDLDPLEASLNAAQEELTAKRREVAEARAQIATLDRELRMRTERLAQIVGESERWMTRASASERQSADLSQRLEQTDTELLSMAELPDLIEEQRQKLLSALADADKARQVAADHVAAADAAHRKAKEEFRATQDVVAAEREGRARTEARLEAARQRRQGDARKIRDALGVMPEGCLALAEVPAEFAMPAYDDLDRAHQRLKGDRERLGGVNLAADEELTGIQEQFDTLDTERADVEAAIAKLRHGIGQLNREGKERLEAAFETVNGHFQRLFAVLFGGGEARLEMIPGEEDPLSGGLEIIAKPPGKKPATLSLLSGGEQTLTALSLIFAVFLTNPSPICVLDEVDAPLDDANVDRFCTMMEKMAEETDTRFLVITHHPMTMARMNRLFGVTMAEKGVSQLVSVDLETARSFREAAA
jgi:chromosome segregation protein